MAIESKLASLARLILEEQSAATIQPNPFALWKRWSRVDPDYELAQSIHDEHGGAFDRNAMDRAMAILTVAEDAFEQYGEADDRTIIASIKDLLITTTDMLRQQLPSAISEFCLAHLVLVAVASEIARQENDDRFRTPWRSDFLAFALPHMEVIRALPELNLAWQAVDLALCYAERVVGINRRIESSSTLDSLSWQTGQFSMESNDGSAKSWWRVQATERHSDPGQIPFVIESVGAGSSSIRFLAASASNELAMGTFDQELAKWTIGFPTQFARGFGHVTIRNISTGLYLVTTTEPNPPAILRTVEQSELDEGGSPGSRITWRILA
jgi:hypothetical protein